MFDGSSKYCNSNTTDKSCFYLSYKNPVGTSGYYYKKSTYVKIGTKNYFTDTTMVHLAFVYNINNDKLIHIFENGKEGSSIYSNFSGTYVMRPYLRIGVDIFMPSPNTCNNNSAPYNDQIFGVIGLIRISDIARYTADFDPYELVKEKFNIKTIRYVYPGISYNRKTKRVVINDQEQRNRYI